MSRWKVLLLEAHRTYSQTHIPPDHPQLCYNEIFYQFLSIRIVLFIELQFFEKLTVNFLIVMLDLTLDKLDAILVHSTPLKAFLSVHIVEERGREWFEE